jgi:hypothetical protein
VTLTAVTTALTAGIQNAAIASTAAGALNASHTDSLIGADAGCGRCGEGSEVCPKPPVRTSGIWRVCARV